MSHKPWMLPAVMLLLVGCTTKNEVTVTGDDSSSIQSSPAGVATNAFVDLECGIGYGVNELPKKVEQSNGEASALQASAAPTCTTQTVLPSGATLLTFTPGCKKGANGWDLTGTLTYASVSSGVNDVAYDLTLTDPTATKTWKYTGTKHVAVTGTSAVVTVSPGNYLTAAYVDTSDTAKNKTYHYTPDLHADWTTGLKIYGSYSFEQVSGNTITASVDQANPLVWSAGCCYPTSGTITLKVAQARAEAAFGPGCGTLKLNGNSVSLASCN